MTEFTPLETIVRIQQRWWWVALLTILGGLLGWGYHFLQSPLYEATATFVLNLDYGQPQLSDMLDRDHYAEDQLIGAAFQMIVSVPVAADVAAELAPAGIPGSALSVGKRVFIERRQAEIRLLVRNEDPETAALIANTWAKRAYASLTEAYGHALRAWDLRNYLTGLTACLQTSPAENSSPCASKTLDELKQEMQSTEAELDSEVLASKGISPWLTFDLSRTAETPQKPISYQTGMLILAGGLIGLLVGIAVTLVKTRK